MEAARPNRAMGPSAPVAEEALALTYNDQPPPYPGDSSVPLRQWVPQMDPAPRDPAKPPYTFDQPYPVVTQQVKGVPVQQQPRRGPEYQTSTAIIVQQTYEEPRPSLAGAIAFSCVTSWLCCWPLGLVAFILAMVARGDSDVQKTKNLRSISYGFSIASLITGIIAIIVYFVA